MHTRSHSRVAVGLLLLLLSSLAPAQVYAEASPDASGMKFVDLLIDRGIIAASAATKARRYAETFFELSKEADPGMHADKVSIHPSQLIQYANRSFAEGETVQGLLLIATNMSDQQIVLESPRNCPVHYRIYDAGDALVFDSATLPRCAADEQVTYLLEPHEARLFEVHHDAGDRTLLPGAYRFVLTYPGYGEGERVVTIVR